MLKVRPFQNHRLRGKNRFDGLKNFGAPQNEENLIFGAPKNEKNDFFKKGKSVISLNIGGHSHSGWGQYVVYQGLGSIRLI